MCQLSSNITCGSSLLFPPDAIFTLDSDAAPGTYSCPFCKNVGRKMQVLYIISFTERITAIFFLHRSELCWRKWDCSIDHSFPLCNKRRRKSRDRRTWEQTLSNCIVWKAATLWCLVTLHRCLGSLQRHWYTTLTCRCLPCTRGSQGTSADAAYGLSVILSLLLLFQTVYGSALQCSMCHFCLLNRTTCSQWHLLTVSEVFIAFRSCCLCKANIAKLQA